MSRTVFGEMILFAKWPIYRNCVRIRMVMAIDDDDDDADVNADNNFEHVY